MAPRRLSTKSGTYLLPILLVSMALLVAAFIVLTAVAHADVHVTSETLYVVGRENPDNDTGRADGGIGKCRTEAKDPNRESAWPYLAAAFEPRSSTVARSGG